MKREKAFRPDRIGSYFRVEWLPLALVTLSGLIYNIGLLATPWFEGRLAQCLADILGGNADCRENGGAGACLYSRHAGGAGRAVYQAVLCPPLRQQHQPPDEGHPVRQSGAAEAAASLEQEGAGELMTKAISDVDDCVEGMRKFTTEVFDTGVALVGYAVMLLVYDWRLAILSLLFTPVSYVCAAWMKRNRSSVRAPPTKKRRAHSARPRWIGRRTP